MFKRTLSVIVASYSLAVGCGRDLPRDCEMTSDVIAPTTTSALGFSWNEVRLPTELTTVGGFAQRVRSDAAPQPQLSLGLHSDGAILETVMVANEPSHFSDSRACTSRLSRSATASIRISEGFLVGEFSGPLDAFSETEFTFVGSAPAADVLGDGVTPDIDRVDVVLDSVDGYATIKVIGVQTFAQHTDEHGGVSSGGKLTQLFVAENVPIAGAESGG